MELRENMQKALDRLPEVEFGNIKMGLVPAVEIARLLRASDERGKVDGMIGYIFGRGLAPDGKTICVYHASGFYEKENGVYTSRGVARWMVGVDDDYDLIKNLKEE